MKKQVIICLTFSLIQVTCQAQIPAFVTDSLDAYIARAMQVWQIPGVAVCVVKDGQIIHQKGYGVRRFGTIEAVNEHTVFPIASVTKTFVGTAWATLEAEKKVQLNQPLKQILPSFSMNHKLYEAQISIADVLSHRSGWKTFQGDLLNTESSLSQEIMLRKFGLIEPAYPIRTRFGYSNFGFMLAGEALQSVSGQDWATFLQKRFFEPLGMNRTFTKAEAIQRATNISTPHSLSANQIVPLLHDEINPQAYGGVYSSVHDLGIWLRVLLEKGDFEGKQIIPESAIQKMWMSHTIIGKDFAADRHRYFKTYGLGWELMQYQNQEVVQHGGAYAGTLTMVGLIPTLRLGVVILTNQDGHLLQEALKWQIFDAFLEKPAPDYVQVIAERRRKRKTEQPITQNAAEKPVSEVPFSVPMETLIGTYENEVYGKTTVERRNGDYILRLENHPKVEAVLTASGASEMTCTYNHPMFGKTALPVEINNGKVKGFTLFVDAFIEGDGYVFRKII
ncbi:serine hydrolase [Runella slithyformis]|uniref:Beta-lactamase n=1 Tax=Runella slithyformis (strain ATCC 29530 / DSM 19594 / LMG 11500 / NCIMB 11436 / LSU 4) TaxID=761193 RepID=A0A7U3ZRD1_RUNSL|nr:serine hydrolase [Runella slithyformis]AEI51966.1 beta-lactamase [Runella slithyformis DSM 19594]